MPSKPLTEQIKDAEKLLNELKKKLHVKVDKAHGNVGRFSSFLSDRSKKTLEAGQKMTDTAILKVLEKYLKQDAFKNPSMGGRKKKTKKKVQGRKGKSRGRKTRGRKRRR